MIYPEKLKQYTDQKQIPESVSRHMLEFYEEYAKTVERKGDSISNHELLFDVYLELVRDQCLRPFKFDHFHRQLRAPMDYHQFGIEFIRPLLYYPKCKIYGLEIFDQIEQQISKGENVVFLANHQIEADPQVIKLLLERTHPDLGENMIFVAGERVITDPVAVPFSLGCNLLCIYSKRYIDTPPEQHHEKQIHNQKTMKKMSELLGEGGKAIYVAPSGGRDRPDAHGAVQIAEFDAPSIEMFYLMAKRSKRPTHFYPLAMKTYDLLPPPQDIQSELGERRQIKGGNVSMAVAPQIDMETFPGSDTKDKHARRKIRADYIQSLVKEAYATL